jgi:hypothetical protein
MKVILHSLKAGTGSGKYMLRKAVKSHFYVRDYPRFAKVTVGQLDQPVNDGADLPIVYLNGTRIEQTEAEKEVTAAAEMGIKEAEDESGWQGVPHILVSIEGLLVDGIDAESARIAAAAATRQLIRRE